MYKIFDVNYLSLHFCKIQDHILFTIDQSLNVNFFYIPLLKKTNFCRFNWNVVKFELQIISRDTSSHFNFLFIIIIFFSNLFSIFLIINFLYCYADGLTVGISPFEFFLFLWNFLNY